MPWGLPFLRIFPSIPSRLVSSLFSSSPLLDFSIRFGLAPVLSFLLLGFLDLRLLSHGTPFCPLVAQEA